jgi:hypothetical protein
MTGYRVHFLDVWGRIIQTSEIQGRDDDHARSLIERHIGLVAMELWHGDRVVERYEADLV